MEKSACIVLFLMESLCCLGGNVVELGAGTGPALKAAIHSGRSCLAIEFDEDICSKYLQVYVDEVVSRKKGKEKLRLSSEDDVEEDFELPDD